MSFGRILVAVTSAAAFFTVSARSWAVDLIMNGGTVTLGGVQTYNIVSLTNGATVQVTPYNGVDKINTGNLVIKASSITIDATSVISAKGAGYFVGLCKDGNGPGSAGGRGGCSVRDSAGGGAHFGNGGRGTKDCPIAGCVFPGGYEENCVGAVNGTNDGCVDTSDCRDDDALPTVAGAAFFHSIYTSEFGAAGGDKGCRDGDGFVPSAGTSVAFTGGNGGGRIVLFAANGAQNGVLSINGTVTTNGYRGCGSGNDSAGGGAGGSLLLIGDSVTIGATARLSAAGGRGGDTQPKPDIECAGTQMNGTCDDCGGGGGGGIVNVLSRVASISPLASFDVSGALGGVCPICTGEAGGGAGELQIDGAYVGEVCDGFDNDFNGSVDDGLPPLNCNGNIIPSCVGGVPQQCPPQVPACIGQVTDTRPRFVVILDSSGSMLNDPAGNPTFGDGSVGHVGVDTSSDADLVDGNNSRLFIAKSALNNVLAAFPHADYALARYHQDVSTNRSCQTANWFECQKLCCSYDDPRNNTSPLHPAPACDLQGLYGAGYPASIGANINLSWPNQGDCINYAGSCGIPRRGADILVGFGKSLSQSLMWLDGKETNFNTSVLPGDHCNFAGGGDCELRGTGPTPLAASLDAAADYLNPIIKCDGAVPCRKYSVILLTDGAESCQGNPVASASALRTSVPGINIQTYVIGFSVLPSEQAQLNAVAVAGGTGAAFFASDQNGLSNALASIISSSAVFETCNGLDDDCDGLVDEDFPDKGQPCDNGLKGVCKGTGVRVCNALGDGTVCQITAPGLAPSAEVCNGLDDNCNGLVDENGICQQCVPTIETCNNIDDNCNGTVDDNPVDANLPCGLALGECSPGFTKCNPGGMLTCVGGVGPQPETCNGLDDDCDGVIDGMTDPCYSGPAGTLGVGVCHSGSQPCIAVPGSGVPAFGACVGELTPSAELCDGLDNDCDGFVDDQVPDGLGHFTGQACCRFAGKCGVGVCTSGVYACAGSQVVCDGGVDPSAELCDGLDNDCNGVVDDVPGKGAPCVLAGGCPGVLDCQVGLGLVCVSGAAGLEVCNGIDDDCDGSIDEEPDVSTNDPTIGVVCDVPVAPADNFPCKPGKTVCKQGVPACEGSVTPTPEVCDGIDNDCDGTVDLPNPCPIDLECVNGHCVSPCNPASEFPCPGGQICVDGYCEDETKDAGTTGSGGAGGSTGTVGSGGGTGGGATAQSSSSSGVVNGSTGSGGAGGTSNETWGLATGGGGCACDLPARGPSGRALGALAVCALALAARRRDRREKRGAR